MSVHSVRSTYGLLFNGNNLGKANAMAALRLVYVNVCTGVIPLHTLDMMHNPSEKE